IVAGTLCEQLFESAFLAFGDRKGGLQIGKLVLHILRIRALQRQKLGKLVDLGVEAVQHLVLPADFAREQKLRKHEDRQQEHDGQEQGRKRIDKARPVVNATFGTATRKRHLAALPLSKGYRD